jgi:hypothetical protein
VAKLTAESIAAAVPERILLFCLASDTNWQAADCHALNSTAHDGSWHDRAPSGRDDMR